MKVRAPQRMWTRALVVLPVGVAVVALFIWQGPSWKAVGDAFTIVRWEWVAGAIGLNLLSVLVRSFAWQTVIWQAMPAPRPRFPLVFSAFSVGLFANAVLPGRIGELARVAVLNRKLPGRRGAWATLVGTVFAHRVFDLVPVVLLIVYVLLTAKIPHWAITSLVAFVAVGVALFAFALASAKRHHHRGVDLELLGPVRRLVAMGRQGLGVMRVPAAALLAITFQWLGWLCQLLAVYTAMRAFDIHAPLPAAGVVLLLMNVATVFPLWPGNVGLVQAAIALPLLSYGVNYARGVAYGIGLQAIEASVGVGVGLLFLAREGLSYTMLKVMPDAAQAEPAEAESLEEGEADAGARARVPG
ncbi:MAG TPA: lysylphosphatidylglycerol synthase transmembrane domain-containing protein [Gaiellaceae bacterium]